MQRIDLKKSMPVNNLFSNGVFLRTELLYVSEIATFFKTVTTLWAYFWGPDNQKFNFFQGLWKQSITCVYDQYYHMLRYFFPAVSPLYFYTPAFLLHHLFLMPHGTQVFHKFLDLASPALEQNFNRWTPELLGSFEAFCPVDGIGLSEKYPGLGFYYFRTMFAQTVEKKGLKVNYWALRPHLHKYGLLNNSRSAVWLSLVPLYGKQLFWYLAGILGAAYVLLQVYNYRDMGLFFNEKLELQAKSRLKETLVFAGPKASYWEDTLNLFFYPSLLLIIGFFCTYVFTLVVLGTLAVSSTLLFFVFLCTGVCGVLTLVEEINATSYLNLVSWKNIGDSRAYCKIRSKFLSWSDWLNSVFKTKKLDAYLGAYGHRPHLLILAWIFFVKISAGWFFFLKAGTYGVTTAACFLTGEPRNPLMSYLFSFWWYAETAYTCFIQGFMVFLSAVYLVTYVRSIIKKRDDSNKDKTSGTSLSAYFKDQIWADLHLVPLAVVLFLMHLYLEQYDYYESLIQLATPKTITLSQVGGLTGFEPYVVQSKGAVQQQFFLKYLVAPNWSYWGLILALGLMLKTIYRVSGYLVASLAVKFLYPPTDLKDEKTSDVLAMYDPYYVKEKVKKPQRQDVFLYHIILRFILLKNVFCSIKGYGLNLDLLGAQPKVFVVNLVVNYFFLVGAYFLAVRSTLDRPDTTVRHKEHSTLWY